MRKEMLSVVLCGTFFVFQASVASDLDDFDPFEDDLPLDTSTCPSSASVTNASKNDHNDAMSDQETLDFFARPTNSDDEDKRVFDGFGCQKTDEGDDFGGSYGTSFRAGSSLLALSFGRSPHSKGLTSKTPHSSPHPSQVMSPVRVESEERPSSTPPVGSMGEDALLSSTPPRIFNISNPILIIKKGETCDDPLLQDQDRVKQRRLRSQSRNNPENQLSRSKDPLSTSDPSDVPLVSLPAASAFDAPAHGHD